MPARPAIYLDSNAGAPLSPRVKDALLPFLELSSAHTHAHPTNPSSIHQHGRSAREVLSRAREQVAKSLKAEADQIVFTSSGSEANQAAIRAVLEPLLIAGKKPHWITSPVEHDCVLQMTSWLRDRGGTISTLSLDQNGAIDVSSFAKLVRPETALVSALWVNNETGVISDIESLAREAAQSSIPLHVDAAQAWGKIPVALSKSDAVGMADFVCFSGHKIGALAGTGVLWQKSPGSLRGPILGKQEKSRRGGTENLIGAVSLGVAAEGIDPQAWDDHVRPLRDRMEGEILRRLPGTRIHGVSGDRVANTSNILLDSEKRDWITALDLQGYSVSVGSACSSGLPEPSHVLQAMGLTAAQALASIRVSLSPELTWSEIEGFVHTLERISR
jgi:cysteine desulfurase